MLAAARRLGVAFFLAATPALAQGLPDLGDPSQLAFSASQERQLGEEIMREIRADKAYLDDPELVDYLNQLGYRLVGGTGTRQEFEFFVIRDPSINAFALPGGFIGVHTGLVLAAQSESELAGVLAHEIAHVTQKHLARMIEGQKTNQLTSLIALAVAILAARSNSQVSTAAIATAGAVNVQSQLNFTRENEREADRVGLQVLEGSGFDGRGMASFFERLQRGTRLYETGAPAYLRTHPLTYERIADIQNRVQSLPYHQVAESTEFLLLKAKLQAELGSPRDAVTLMETNLRDRKYADEAVARYGLAAALLRAGDAAGAAKQIAVLRKQFPPNPIIETLAGEVLFANDQQKAALDLYRQALHSFPHHRALVYGYADVLIRTRQEQEALNFLSSYLNTQRGDPRLYDLEARAYAGIGRRLPQHRAQAEAFVLRGNIPAAIDQLQIAVRSGDGDFYELSAAEARLRELRAMDAENRKQRQQQ